MNENFSFRPKAVIFDMDGLMLDTERPMISVWIEAGKIIGWDINAETAIRTIGLNGDDIRKLCMNELGADFPYDKFNKEVHRFFDEEFEKGIAHKPGLIQLLDHLASLGIPLAVGTSSRRSAAEWKLQKAGLIDRFSYMSCGDEVENGKPAPDIFLRAAELLNVSPAHCVGFEDSPAGLQALASAGIASVFIKDIVEPPKEILATVWKRLDNLTEAIALFTP
jgi:HAD superfamily hydrolase (TIGR01509 family)